MDAFSLTADESLRFMLSHQIQGDTEDRAKPQNAEGD
jgi:hypothetical protein